MFSFFRKPKLVETPKADYQIQVNGLDQYFIYYHSTVFEGNYHLWGDKLIFDSWEAAEKYLFEYLDRQKKLERRVVCEIFVAKD